MPKDELQCDLHGTEEPACAVCIKHQTLLCVSCLLEKGKSSASCNIKSFNNITEERNKILVEYLRHKQTVCENKMCLAENEKKVADLRERLSNEISEKYELLQKHLTELKINSFTLLESKTGDILNELKSQKISLTALEADIQSCLQKVSEDEDENVANSKAQLDTIAKKIKLLDSKKPCIPHGYFSYNKDLEAALKCKKGLGEIQLQLVSLDGYELLPDARNPSKEADNPSILQHVSDNSVTTQVKPKVPNKPKPISRADIESSSEERIDPNNDGKQIKPSVPPRLSGTQEHHPDLKQKGKNTMFSGLFSTEKKAISHTDKANTGTNDLEVYAVFELHATNRIKLRQLINRAIPVTGLKPTRSIWKFSKIVCLGEGHVCLFSETKSPAIVIIELDGSVQCQKTFSDKVAAMVATSPNQLAVVLLKNKPIIKQLKFTNKKFQEESNFRISFREKSVNITGFDYNEELFAITSPYELVIFDADGKIVKSISTTISETSKLVTSYNFKEDCVYILNTEHNTLKCFSYATLSATWAQKIGKLDFSARDMAFYSNKLYVSSQNYIAVFAAKDGASTNTIPTSDILQDCFGVCAFEDVIVFSSDSDDSERARSLAFVAL